MLERPHVVIQTEVGDIEAELFQKEAPVSVANFLRYVQGGFYEGGSFFRTVTMDNQPNNKVKIQVIQAEADPNKEGKVFAPIPLERTRDTGLKHVDGALSMARDGPDTAQHSFSICVGDQPELNFGGKRNPDGQGFAVFGRVVRGMDVVHKIHERPASGQRITAPVRIYRVRIVEAKPLKDGALAFTVSMEQPGTHYYHVTLRCAGLKGQTQDFKMPAWTPGYYKIMDYARNVRSFHSEDGEGRELTWEKTAKNTWRVQSKGAGFVTISYDVYAFSRTVADSFLDESRAFVSPTGLFMHPAGRLQHPATVKIEPHSSFARISTGLDPVDGEPNTFSAANFDVLYDGPILVGNQDVLSFNVRGVPHEVAVIGSQFDRQKLASTLTRLVEAAVDVVGEMPYRHYTFLMLGEGQGGLEHLNSMAVYSRVPDLNDPNGSGSWLTFMTHEFFHLYNVKAIRPIALGPFNYDAENYTNLLWFSEGGTVYYENLIANRAGFLSRERCLKHFSESIANCERGTGHQFQSATQSSFDVWLYFLSRGGDTRNTTISYYDKGAALTMLLDLKIRHETQGRRSLDDAMRTLYQQYYKQKQRGFTDQEFRQVCESTAGCSLAGFFDVYASTTQNIDYGKYLAYAGLGIEPDFTIKPLPEPEPLQSQILKGWLSD
jgi:predicted metalloprotease with PDZ domain/cyclophilin family peptidyl-prolyl cis-trans isomerase